MHLNENFKMLQCEKLLLPADQLTHSNELLRHRETRMTRMVLTAYACWHRGDGVCVLLLIPLRCYHHLMILAIAHLAVLAFCSSSRSIPLVVLAHSHLLCLDNEYCVQHCYLGD